jgi:hypothetical protein
MPPADNPVDATERATRVDYISMCAGWSMRAPAVVDLNERAVGVNRQIRRRRRLLFGHRKNRYTHKVSSGLRRARRQCAQCVRDLLAGAVEHGQVAQIGADRCAIDSLGEAYGI